MPALHSEKDVSTLTQQVVHAKFLLPSTTASVDGASFGLTLEATGSGTTLDFSTAQTPQNLLTTFINGTIGAQVHPLSFYLSPDLDHTSNACSITWTDVTAHLDGSNAGGPFRTDTFTLGAASHTQGLPPSVAVPVALRADYGTDIEHGTTASLPSTESAIDQGAPATHTGTIRPRARDRARFYLGPLDVGVLGIGGAPLQSTFASDLDIAVNGLVQTHNTVSANQFNIVVWSRRAAAVKPVTFYAIPGFFGVVRKRGDETLTRVHSWTARH